MDLITTLLIAVGLCFDTFAVSVSCGLLMNRILFFQAVRIALFMSIFQGLNPWIGWLAGSSIEKYFHHFGPWLAFLLLLFIGLRMVFESLRNKGNRKLNPLHLGTLIGLSLATSIDALVVGISLAFSNVNIYLTVFVIGTVTFLASMLGILFGKKTGVRFSNRLEIAGGIVIILIGVKILLEHLLQAQA